MGKFAKSLIKIANDLYSTGMEERYTPYDPESETEFKGGGHSSPTEGYKDYLRKVQGTGVELKGDKPRYYNTGPKFMTGTPATSQVTAKDYKYKKFTSDNDFSAIAPFIIQAESGGKYYKSLKPNTNGSIDYGFFQINDLNLDRKTSGGKLADAWDPIFDKYYNYYNDNLAGKTIDGITYDKLTGDSKDIETRKQLLQTKHDKFNSYGSSLSWDLSEQLYNQRGIGQWTTKDQVLAMAEESQNDQNNIASSDN